MDVWEPSRTLRVYGRIARVARTLRRVVAWTWITTGALLTASPVVAQPAQESGKAPITRGESRVQVTVTGQGGVTTSPPGLDCGSVCRMRFPTGTTLRLVATPAPGHRFAGWGGSCSGRSECALLVGEAAAHVGATFLPLPAGRFAARPFLFKADEVRLRASLAANDPEAVGPAQNVPGSPMGFLTLARAAVVDRATYRDIPTWHLALAGWLLNDSAMLIRARDEALAIVGVAPSGDTGHGEHFQHVEDRILNVAAVADLAHAHFSTAQLDQVAKFVNGSLANWNKQNTTFWPGDEPLNNYWQNGFLAHVVGSIATEGFNPQASSWRTSAEAMARKFTERTTLGWTGPVQSEGHYYSGYVNNAFWAMELYDAAMGTDWLARSQFSPAAQLDLLMFQTRPHLAEFFEVGSEANVATAPHTFLSLTYWHHLISSGRYKAQAQHAKAILHYVLNRPNAMIWPRWSKGFVNFYWNIYDVPLVPLSAKTERLYVAPSPGAGLVGLRSSVGFQPEARAAIIFATQFAAGAAYSHSNPDAPGFQWADGTDWLVTDPEYFNRSGILAEAGSSHLSDVSNIVTLAGYKQNATGLQPQITFAEDNRDAQVPHFYVQINAQPYWNVTRVYRRDYVWLDDLRVVLIWDRIVGPPVKKWRLHVPGVLSVNGPIASYAINGKSVTVKDLMATSSNPWMAESTLGVWRLYQDDAASDYRSLKLLDLGGRVSAATQSRGPGWYQASLTVDNKALAVRFYDDGRHAMVTSGATAESLPR